MKKIALFVMATIITTAVLAGCGSSGTLGSSRGNSGSSSGSSGSSSAGSGNSDRSSASSGTTENRVGYPDEYGNAEGRIGDTMHTYFFDYTVNSAYLCDEYEGYEPVNSGYEILVADVTIKNTFIESLPMFDSDFQVQWGDDADDAYEYPITCFYLEEGEVLNDQMLPYEYELSINQSVNGLLVFEVPAGKKDFSISYLELFDDDTSGDVFFVYFTADKH